MQAQSPIAWERGQNSTHQTPPACGAQNLATQPAGNKQVFVNIQKSVNLSILTPPSSARKQLSRQRTGKRVPLHVLRSVTPTQLAGRPRRGVNHKGETTGRNLTNFRHGGSE